MHDAMPDSRSYRELSVGQKLADTGYGVFGATDGSRYRENAIAGGIDCVNCSMILTDRFRFCGHQNLGLRGPDLVKAELQ